LRALGYFLPPEAELLLLKKEVVGSRKHPKELFVNFRMKEAR
jgi:hypothetical protein